MLTYDMKLITVITESALEHTLEADIERLGGRGFTITDARGKGHRGTRDAGWSGDSNIRIEVAGKAEIIDAIADFLSETYYNDYAMMIYLSDIQILRRKKFS